MMPEKKPVIVVKKSRLQGAAVENTVQHASKPFAGVNREKMAHFARTFPALWPDFDKGKFRPMKVGIKEQVKAYIDAHPDCGMTFSQWVMAVRVVISRIEYQRCVKEGKTRYDIHGEPAGEVSAKEAQYARLQVARIKAKLDARRDAREKKDVTTE